MKFQTVRGMRDFLPEQMRKKQFIEDYIRKVFESYGYEPVQTPIVEEFGLLSAKGSGGEAIKEEIYYFRDKSDRELGLRYDLTVPLGRIAAGNPNLAKPFKRYCIGQVYRYDRPQAKRYREFTQADADIVGAKSVAADFECIQIAVDVMRGLGFEFVIKVNDRRVLEELALKMGVEKEQVPEAFRLIDKIDKAGLKEAEKQFKEKKIDARILGQVEANSLSQTKDYLEESEALKGLEKVFDLCRQSGYREVEFGLSLARGLEYYTGIVFEVSVLNGPSVAAGGRYDKLIGLYGGQETPAVGISFGVDRLYDYLEETLVAGPNTDVFITPLGNGTVSTAFSLAAKMRKLGISVEVDLMGRNMKKNFEYVEKRGIPFVVVLGENEVRAKKFKIKDTASRAETEFSTESLKGLRELVKP